MTWSPSPRYRTRRAAAFTLAAIVGLHAAPPAVEAHHGGRLSVPLPTCGWTEGGSLRDRRNLSEFCARSVPRALEIPGAGADRERLWLEAPSDLSLLLRDDERSAAALLGQWLSHWREISGYRTVTIVLMRNHVEIARVYTTMAGDVVARTLHE